MVNRLGKFFYETAVETNESTLAILMRENKIDWVIVDSVEDYFRMSSADKLDNKTELSIFEEVVKSFKPVD